MTGGYFLALKSASQKKLRYLFHWKPFKNNKWLDKNDKG